MIIELKQGPLEGLARKSILTGQEYGSFLGIPYAKPPVGDLRFQPPQPIEKWDGILKAFEEGSPCIQRDISTGKYIGSEDCLYLNVYTPKPSVDNASKKAVMVFIHGGGFYQGSGSRELYSADYLINYDIILVTFNYRLHALGFLDLGTKNYSGNCGLRDQHMVLKWVKENVENFGGDPGNITIFGESAGGCSVHFQLLSPFSRGLFQKAIIQSDPTYHFFKNGSNAQKLGLKLAKKLNSEETDPEKLMEFFKKQPTLELCKHASVFFREALQLKQGAAQSDMFGPSVEFQREDAFLPDTVENLMKKVEAVPLIVGITDKEGRLAFPFLGKDRIEEFDFTKMINHPSNMDSSTFQSACSKIKEYYFCGKPLSEETLDNLADLFTDYWFKNLYEFIDFEIKSQVPLYIYEFGYHGRFNVMEKITLKDHLVSSSGTCHGDDLPYLFYTEKLLPELKEVTEPERGVIENMCSLWTNFAKYGNPSETFKNVEWKRYTSAHPCYLRIDEELKMVEEKLREKQFDFWAKLQLRANYACWSTSRSS